MAVFRFMTDTDRGEKMKEKVLFYLKEQNDYRSGEEISQKLGVTRAAVWKAINKLREEGYEILSSTKRGYKLMVSPNSITAHEIKEVLKAQRMGVDIRYYDEIDSTNNEAKKLAREGCLEGTVVIADCQKSGRGRLGRVWDSPPGEGIWMSLILRPHLLPTYASQLTLVAGNSMCEAISKVTGLKAKIKWPNDIVVNSKKVCGILTEMSTQMECIDYVIIGIGVNVNTAAFKEELPYATSLLLEGHQEYSRKAVVAAFLECFEADYDQYLTYQSLSFLKERYEKNCITLHQKVKLIGRADNLVAEAVGITDEGSLVVKKEDGKLEEVSTGEVSVRGLYGYI